MYKYEYVDGLVPLRRSAPLRFGGACHKGLEAWGLVAIETGSPVPAEALQAALSEAMAPEKPRFGPRPGPMDPYEQARLQAVLEGYHVMWCDQELRVLGVEVPYDTEIKNPVTGHASKTYSHGGRIDGLVEVDSSVYVHEIKTSSEDISPGSNYWKRLRMNGQVDSYVAGGRSLGHDVAGVLYDVLRKPGIQPHKATPVEDRKYTEAIPERPCGKCRGKGFVAKGTEACPKCDATGILPAEPSRLYANQREMDETPVEFLERCRDVIAKDPEAYYQRQIVVRLQAEEDDAAYDLWHGARELRESELASRWPRNPDACMKWGSTCAYFGLCTRENSPDDPTLFTRRPPEVVVREEKEAV